MIANGPKQKQLSKLIAHWMRNLNDYPGWNEWKGKHIDCVITHGDTSQGTELEAGTFQFSGKTALEHDLIMKYMALVSLSISLSEVEYYFRRYPFSNLPVSRHSHLRTCCDLYFSRFYQFKERVKKLSRAVKAAYPDHNLNFGKLITRFESQFKSEIKARHGIHHHEDFSEVGLDQISLLELLEAGSSNTTRRNSLNTTYRKSANKWARRVRSKSRELDAFVEIIADALIDQCAFLHTSTDNGD